MKPTYFARVDLDEVGPWAPAEPLDSIGRRRSGFTLLELMVTVFVIAVLAALLLPAVTRARSRAKGTSCLNNTRQLMMALHTYANDFQDRLPPNLDDGKMKDDFYWCSGQAGRGMEQEFDTEIFKNPHMAMLYEYLGKSVALYRCPADRRVGKSQNLSDAGKSNPPMVPAARSIAMNAAVGTDPKAGGGLPTEAPWLDGDYKNTRAGPFRTYGRLADFTDPGPANTWVLIDESDFNLNDAAFAVSMVGSFWLDYPGRYHNSASGIVFADGHSEYHRWTTVHVPSRGQPEPAVKNPDWIWLRDRTSAPK